MPRHAKALVVRREIRTHQPVIHKGAIVTLTRDGRDELRERLKPTNRTISSSEHKPRVQGLFGLQRAVLVRRAHQQEFRSARDSGQTANLRFLVAQIAGERLLMTDIVIDSEPGRADNRHNSNQRNSGPSPAPIARVFPKLPEEIRRREDVSAAREGLGAIKKRQP